MGAIESVGFHLARLLPGADASTLRRLEGAAQQQTFGRRDVLHARGIQLLLRRARWARHGSPRCGDGTGVRRADRRAWLSRREFARSATRDGDAFYELVALTDGTWATWDPRFVRGLALQDAGLAVGLLDRSSDFTVVLNMRLDERSFEMRASGWLPSSPGTGRRSSTPPSSCAASRPGSHDRYEPRDDVPGTARAGSRRSRETRTQRRHQDPGRGATGPTGHGGAPDGAPAL